MKGLLLKEYYVMKRYGKTYLLFLICFGGSALFTGNIGMYAGMAVLFMSNIPLSSFTVDDACRWDQLAVSTPVSRKTIVGSKYLLFFIMSGVSVLLCMGIVLLGRLVHPGGASFPEQMIGVLAAIGTMGTMMMVLLPFVLKLGAEKGRIIMMMIFGSTFAAIMLVGLLVENSGIGGNMLQGMETAMTVGVLVVLPLVLLGVAVVSYRISCRIYAKREF